MAQQPGPSQDNGAAARVGGADGALRATDTTSFAALMVESMQRTHHVWPALSAEGKVLTREFLECSNLVVRFIDTIGVLFAPVARDVEGNIKKLMAMHLQNPERYRFIQDMLDDEARLRRDDATEAMLWLRRGLSFLCTFIESLVRDHDTGVDGDSLVTNLRHSYESTLRLHHGLVLRQLFNLLVGASPTRRQLLQRLSAIVNVENVNAFMELLRTFNVGLRTNLSSLTEYYERHNLQR